MIYRRFVEKLGKRGRNIFKFSHGPLHLLVLFIDRSVCKTFLVFWFLHHFLLMFLKWNVLFSRCWNLKIDIKSWQNAVIEIDNIVTFVISAALRKPERFYLLICSKHCKVSQCVQVCTVRIRFSNTHYLTLKPCLLFGYNGIAMHLENTSKWASTWWTIIVLLIK